MNRLIGLGLAVLWALAAKPEDVFNSSEKYAPWVIRIAKVKQFLRNKKKRCEKIMKTKK